MAEVILYSIAFVVFCLVGGFILNVARFAVAYGVAGAYLLVRREPPKWTLA